MVILFSKSKCTIKDEISEVLFKCGGDLINNKAIRLKNGDFTVFCATKPYKLDFKTAVAVFCDENQRLEDLTLPKGTIGICEAGNQTALKILKKNGVGTIVCGNSAKNTVTVSSITADSAIISLQRTIYDLKGKKIEPADFKIKPPKNYSPFSIMASAAVLLLCGKSKKEKDE